MDKCNINFISNHAYFEDKIISVEEYENNQTKYEKNIICNKGHRLCFVNCVIRRKHFRHVNSDANSEDVGGTPMTNWHTEWQREFPFTEVHFPKIKDQIKDRHADAVVSNKWVVEFQHSKMLPNEGSNRIHDYKLNNMLVIWVIHGHNVEVVDLPYHQRKFLTFNESWMYNSYIDSKLIWIDINDQMYKVEPNQVKGGMIDVNNPISRDEFINKMKANDESIITPDPTIQCTLSIRQQGAGNGKTYGLVQRVVGKEMEHYEHIIMITKMHSAKYTIAEEFNKQHKKGLLKNITLVEGQELVTENGNKFEINFIDANQNQRLVVIGTIDSLMYQIGNITKNSIDQFGSLVKSIIDGAAKAKESIKYSNKTMSLNKSMCLVCDEMQDLPIDYAKALIQIMRDRYIDCVIVGDLLQSIWYTNNAFNYMQNVDFPNIKINNDEKSNICRRFGDTRLVEFVNKSINFEGFKLPSITAAESSTSNFDPVHVFHAAKGTNSEDEPFSIENKTIENMNLIMDLYKKEVHDFNRDPQDFLIVTPFVKNSPLINSLNEAINDFWRQYKDNDNFTIYSVLHKSEEGTSIDLGESKEATRIVSIHSSKGDGRKVVFLVNFNEEGLKKYCKDNDDNLLYESLLHVSLTRMMEKIYVHLTGGEDDLARRFKDYVGSCDKFTRLHSCVNICELAERATDEESMIIREVVNCNPEEIVNDEIKEHNIIDIKHHMIRYYSMMIATRLRVLNSGDKKQSRAVFEKIKCLPTITYDDFGKYMTEMKGIPTCIKCDKIHNPACPNSRLEPRLYHIPLYSSKRKIYSDYNSIIKRTIEKIQEKIKLNLKNGKEDICPYEAIILHYMISITDNLENSDIRHNDVLELTHIYDEAFVGITGHDTCTCKQSFEHTGRKSNNKLTDYIKNHYELMNQYIANLDSFMNEHPKLNYLFNWPSARNGIFNCMYTLIGYNNKNAYNIIIHPNVNNMNIVKLVNKSVLSTFHLCNQNNTDKFKDCSEFQSIILSTNARHNIATMPAKYRNEDIINAIKSISKTILCLAARSIRGFILYRKPKSLYAIEIEYKKKYGNKPIPEYALKLFDALDNSEIDVSDDVAFTNQLKKCISKYVEQGVSIAYDKNEETD